MLPWIAFHPLHSSEEHAYFGATSEFSKSTLMDFYTSSPSTSSWCGLTLPHCSGVDAGSQCDSCFTVADADANLTMVTAIDTEASSISGEPEASIVTVPGGFLLRPADERTEAEDHEDVVAETDDAFPPVLLECDFGVDVRLIFVVIGCSECPRRHLPVCKPRNEDVVSMMRGISQLQATVAFEWRGLAQNTWDKRSSCQVRWAVARRFLPMLKGMFVLGEYRISHVGPSLTDRRSDYSARDWHTVPQMKDC